MIPTLIRSPEPASDAASDAASGAASDAASGAAASPPALAVCFDPQAVRPRIMVAVKIIDNTFFFILIPPDTFVRMIDLLSLSYNQTEVKAMQITLLKVQIFISPEKKFVFLRWKFVYLFSRS